jgi:hypothetical protein
VSAIEKVLRDNLLVIQQLSAKPGLDPDTKQKCEELVRLAKEALHEFDSLRSELAFYRRFRAAAVRHEDARQWVVTDQALEEQR